MTYSVVRELTQGMGDTMTLTDLQADATTDALNILKQQLGFVERFSVGSELLMHTILHLQRQYKDWLTGRDTQTISGLETKQASYEMNWRDR